MTSFHIFHFSMTQKMKNMKNDNSPYGRYIKKNKWYNKCNYMVIIGEAIIYLLI